MNNILNTFRIEAVTADNGDTTDRIFSQIMHVSRTVVRVMWVLRFSAFREDQSVCKRS